MSIRRLTLTTTLGAIGALLVVTLVGAACVVTTDNGPGTTTGTGSTTTAGTDSGTGGTTTTPGDDGGTTTTPTTTTPGDDSGTTNPWDWTKSDAVYARFVLASSDFATGTNFDICYAPWDGNTAVYPADSAYIGPIAMQVGGSGAYFTSPEVTNYFQLNSAIDGSSVTKIAVRLVVPGGSGPDSAHPCYGTNRFQLSGSTIKINDDTTDNLVKGFNTVVVYGNLGTSSTYTLTDVFGEDPKAAPTVPTLEFFNGYDDGSHPGMSFTFTGSDGTTYNFSGFGSGGLGYGKYTALPLVFTGSWGAAVSIQTAAFTVGGAAAFNVSLGGFSLTNQYYWGFAYGAALGTDFHLYLCPDSVAIASASDYSVHGCNVYNP